jgi:paraquat-inducible protein A
MNEIYPVTCHCCCKVSYLKAGGGRWHSVCPRCGASLHFRKKDSLTRTWALTLTALILYVPANLLPVMTVTMTGRAESDTIFSGVQTLLIGGMWPLALLVFFASIAVPVLKLVVMIFLLLSVQFRWQWNPKYRTRLYGITESIGRWSMIDIFVITILVAVVQMGALATIEAGPGAVTFGGVVIFTMLAAMSFDPRLIWDAIDEEQ